MKTMREKFEVLPEIKRMVSCDEIKWCNVYNWYRTDNTDANSIYHVAWLNGAWYAFQEQQNKIDDVEEEYAETERQLKDKIQELGVRIKEKDYIIESDKLLISKLRSY